jgi:hypothetical protein
MAHKPPTVLLVYQLNFYMPQGHGTIVPSVTNHLLLYHQDAVLSLLQSIDFFPNSVQVILDMDEIHSSHTCEVW